MLPLCLDGVAGFPGDAAAVAVSDTLSLHDALPILTVWPCGEAMPLASNLNLTAGVTDPNLVIVKVGGGGGEGWFTMAWTHLVADLAGLYTAGASYATVQPVRGLDTRPGSEVGGAGGRVRSGAGVAGGGRGRCCRSVLMGWLVFLGMRRRSR